MGAVIATLIELDWNPISAFRRLWGAFHGFTQLEQIHRRSLRFCFCMDVHRLVRELVAQADLGGNLERGGDFISAKREYHCLRKKDPREAGIFWPVVARCILRGASRLSRILYQGQKLLKLVGTFRFYLRRVLISNFVSSHFSCGVCFLRASCSLLSQACRPRSVRHHILESGRPRNNLHELSQWSSVHVLTSSLNTEIRPCTLRDQRCICMHHYTYYRPCITYLQGLARKKFFLGEA